MVLKPYQEFSDFVMGGDDEGTMTFEEWRTEVRKFIGWHAQARNDIYDYEMRMLNVDEDGHFFGNLDKMVRVTREEFDVRKLLHIYHLHYGKEAEE